MCQHPVQQYLHSVLESQRGCCHHREQLRHQLDVVVDELSRLRTQVAVPDEPELVSTYGMGPAASKVYGVERGDDGELHVLPHPLHAVMYLSGSRRSTDASGSFIQPFRTAFSSKCSASHTNGRACAASSSIACCTVVSKSPCRTRSMKSASAASIAAALGSMPSASLPSSRSLSSAARSTQTSAP